MAAMRNHTIDSLRIVAILAVIVLHAKPFVSAQYLHTGFAPAGEILVQWARFAVPFFFITTGYFLGKKQGNNCDTSTVRHYLKRIGLLYVAWCAIYFFVSPNWLLYLLDGNPKPLYWHLAAQTQQLINTPVLFALKGSRVHLWFLPALLIAVALTSLCRRASARPACLISFAGLYLLGLLGDTYARTPFGLTIDPTVVHAFFYAPLLLVIGIALANRPAPGLTVALTLIAIGFAMQLFEARMLAGSGAHLFANYDFYLGTVPLSIGVLSLALARPGWGQHTLAPLGKWVLGVYLVHLLVKDVLIILDKTLSGPLWEMGFPLLILIASLVLVSLAWRTRLRVLFQ